MLFVEIRFAVFFALVVALHWGLRSLTARKALLLVASYAFYAAWDWRFLGLILLSTGVDYLAALRIAAAPSPRAKRRWVGLSLGVNLGMLGLFKYFNFFIDSMRDLLGSVGMPWGGGNLEIILPVGISFYTFQTLSYTLDVYRGSLAPRRSPLDVALFVAFFPQLVAGPIVRARDFLPQLDTPRRWATVPVRACLVLFLAGFIKKACVSDNLAPTIDAVFAAPDTFGWLAILGGALLYAVQIYCDFSGYSDMAIASAGLLGYALPLNFDAPYFAADIAAFWRRWHISLSTWLRDYLYIPLGGSRGSAWFTGRNLMLTMVLGGLWHGAAYTFVIWGALHGIALVVHRAWRGRRALPPLLGMGLTFAWVSLAWIFFRADSLDSALQMVGMLGGWISCGTGMLPLNPLGLFAGLVAVHAAGVRFLPQVSTPRLPAPLFAIAYGCAWALALAAMATDYRPFIYFQF